MSANFAPDLNYTTSGVENFRFWCQKTLPLVYDDSLSYYELLCKLAKFVADATADISTLDNAYLLLQDYVNHYFDSLDIQSEIDDKLDEMAQDGSLGQLINRYITRNKNVVIITASYGDPNYNGSATSDATFLTKCKYRLEHNSGIYCYYGYQSGASFGYTENASGSQYKYTTAITRCLAMIEQAGGDPNNVGQVIIVGGGNDINHSRSAIADGMAEVTEMLKENFPNAILRFAWASWRKASGSVVYDKYNACITLHKELCAKHGIGYCHNSEFIFHQYNESWYSDDIHPSLTGADYFADGIVECILTGSCDCVKEEKFIYNVEQGSGDTPNPFLTRNSAYPYLFQSLTDFTVRQVNETTYIIPGKTQSKPSIQIDSGAMGDFGSNPASMVPKAFARTNSNLLRCCGSADQYGGFPVNIYVYNSDNTIANSVQALGKYLVDWDDVNHVHYPTLWLNCFMDSSYYPCGTGGTMKIYLPTVALPTAFC